MYINIYIYIKIFFFFVEKCRFSLRLAVRLSFCPFLCFVAIWWNMTFSDSKCQLLLFKMTAKERCLCTISSATTSFFYQLPIMFSKSCRHNEFYKAIEWMRMIRFERSKKKNFFFFLRFERKTSAPVESALLRSDWCSSELMLALENNNLVTIQRRPFEERLVERTCEEQLELRYKRTIVTWLLFIAFPSFDCGSKCKVYRFSIINYSYFEKDMMNSFGVRGWESSRSFKTRHLFRIKIAESDFWCRSFGIPSSWSPPI